MAGDAAYKAHADSGGKMKNEGDFVSGLTDTEPLSSYAEGRDENT